MSKTNPRQLAGLALAVLFSAGCASAPSKDEAAEAAPVTITPEMSVAMGDRAWGAGDEEKALFHYLEATRDAPDVAGTWLKIAVLESRLGRPEVAMGAYARVLALEPEHPVALEETGLIYLARREAAPAREHLERAVRADPRRWRAMNGLGVMADLEGEHAVAADWFGRAIAVNPDSAMLQNNLGYSLYLAGNLEMAERQFRMAMSLDRGFSRAWRNLGLVLARQGYYEEALPVLMEVMDEPEAYNALGYVCMLEGRRYEAERYLREAIHRSPRYYEAAHENLARLQSMPPVRIEAGM